MLDSNSLSHIGLVRNQNEDSYIADSTLGLWVVADGVGGNGFGDVASQITVQTVERKIRQGVNLVQATADANSAVKEASAGQVEYQNMATTVVACQIHSHTYEISWVGDSRAYLIDQHAMTQLTVDHNLANLLFEKGLIEKTEVQSHPGQHELTQAIGFMDLDKPPVCVGELHDKEYLLLCTDGLCGVISDAETHRIILESSSLQEASDHLLQAVLAAGAPDNVTFTLLQYHEDSDEIQASDFEKSGYRLPFDKAPYLEHCKSRPWLLGIIMLSIIFLFWLV